MILVSQKVFANNQEMKFSTVKALFLSSFNLQIF
jgi:hypothetical protein